MSVLKWAMKLQLRAAVIISSVVLLVTFRVLKSVLVGGAKCLDSGLLRLCVDGSERVVAVQVWLAELKIIMARPSPLCVVVVSLLFLWQVSLVVLILRFPVVWT